MSAKLDEHTSFVGQPTASQDKNPYALVIGDAILDIVGTRMTAKVMQPNGSAVGTICDKPGGVARNTAVNLARLACDCRLISVFGDDQLGRELMNSTRLSGVDLSLCRQIAGAATARCLILNGHTAETFYIMGDPTLFEQLTPDVLSTHRDQLTHAALIVANTVLSEPTLTWLFTQHGDRPIFIDTVNADLALRIRPWLGRIHTLKPNRYEASLLSGLPFNSRDDAPVVAHWFHHAGVRQVVLSLGAHGLYYSDGAQTGWLLPLSVERVNVTGAGDALMAGLAYGWLHGLPFGDSVAFGNACAALTLTTQANNYPALSVAKVHALLTRALPVRELRRAEQG